MLNSRPQIKSYAPKQKDSARVASFGDMDDSTRTLARPPVHSPSPLPPEDATSEARAIHGGGEASHGRSHSLRKLEGGPRGPTSMAGSLRVVAGVVFRPEEALACGCGRVVAGRWAAVGSPRLDLEWPD